MLSVYTINIVHGSKYGNMHIYGKYPRRNIILLSTGGSATCRHYA